MLKRLILLLLMLSPFVFSNAWADKVKSPEIFTMVTTSGDTFRIYETAMSEIVSKIGSEKGSVEIDAKNKKVKIVGYSPLVEKIISLREEAKVSNNTSNNKKGWQPDNEGKISIQFDKDRDLIMQVAIF
jgi:hypothetical protein